MALESFFNNNNEIHQLDPTSIEATIATTEEPQKEQRKQLLRKINTVCNFYKKKSCRHDMTGEECKFLHPAPCRKYIETMKEVAEHSARSTIQNSANILGPQGNVTMIGASEYISRAQGASRPHLRLRYQVQLHKLQTNNKL